MRRVLPFLVALSLPAPAYAAPLAEAPLTRLDDAFSFCATPTGAPAELIAAGPDRFSLGGSVQLYEATPRGFTRGDRIRLADQLNGCPVAAARPDGAAVAAAPATDHGRFELAYVVRPPGGDWGAPATIPARARATVQRVAAAIDDAGNPVLLWSDAREAATGLDYVVRAQVNGAVQTLADTGPVATPDLRVGIAADGQAVVLWGLLLNRTQLVQAAVAPAGGPFGEPVNVGEASPLSTPALAMADDGRALAVLPRLDGLDVAERPPGGAFGAPTRAAPAADRAAVATAAALDSHGAAAIAWLGYADGQAGVVTRSAPGAFGPPRILAAAARPAGDPFFDSQAYFLPDAEPGELAGRGNPSVALTPAGARVAWRRGDHVRVATAAATQTLSGGLRTPTTLALLPGGAVAWVDESRDRITDDHLHLAIARGTAKDKPAPRLTVGAPVRRRLAPGEALTLRLRCSAACEVRARTPSGGDGTFTRLTRGAGRIDISSQTRTLAPTHTRRIRVTFRYGAPGAQHPRTKTVAVRLTGVPLPPTPRIHDLRAVRSGNDVVVSWRIDHPTAYAGYWVSGAASATATPLVSTGAGPTTNSRRAFSARLHDAAGVEVVVVHLRDDATGRMRRAATGVVP